MTLRERLGLTPAEALELDRRPSPAPAPAPIRKPEWVQRMEDERERNLRETGMDRVATKELR